MTHRTFIYEYIKHDIEWILASLIGFHIYQIKECTEKYNTEVNTTFNDKTYSI